MNRYSEKIEAMQCIELLVPKQKLILAAEVLEIWVLENVKDMHTAEFSSRVGDVSQVAAYFRDQIALHEMK